MCMTPNILTLTKHFNGNDKKVVKNVVCSQFE